MNTHFLNRRRVAIPCVLLLSVAAHVVVAGMLVNASTNKRPAPSASRAKSGVQLALRRDAPPAAKPTSASPERNTSATSARPQRQRAERPVAPPKPSPA